MTTENKWTPGPWKVDPDGGAYWIEGCISFSAPLLSAVNGGINHIEFLEISDGRGNHIVQVMGPCGDDVVDPDDPSYLKWPATDEQAQANANLIAASPDMYEALQTVALADDAAADHGMSMAPATRQMVDAALSKARGKHDQRSNHP